HDQVAQQGRLFEVGRPLPGRGHYCRGQCIDLAAEVRCQRHVQTEYLQSSCEELVVVATKISELYADSAGSWRRPWTTKLWEVIGVGGFSNVRKAAVSRTSLRASASRINARSRAGVTGRLLMRTPSGRSASSFAQATAGGATIRPPSPAPFRPY